MTENPYEKGIRILNETINKNYQLMEEYLQNIFNAPSTVNKILTYYAIGFDPAYPNKNYIMFGGKKIREYEFVKPNWKGGFDD